MDDVFVISSILDSGWLWGDEKKAEEDKDKAGEECIDIGSDTDGKDLNDMFSDSFLDINELEEEDKKEAGKEEGGQSPLEDYIGIDDLIEMDGHNKELGRYLLTKYCDIQFDRTPKKRKRRKF